MKRSQTCPRLLGEGGNARLNKGSLRTPNGGTLRAEDLESQRLVFALSRVRTGGKLVRCVAADLVLIQPEISSGIRGLKSAL